MKKLLIILSAVIISVAAIAVAAVPNNFFTQEEAITNEQVASVDITGITITVYPNPSYGKCYLDIRGTHNEIVMMKIFDNQGRTAMRMWVDTSITTVLDLSGLSPGNYVLAVNFNGELGRTNLSLY